MGKNNPSARTHRALVYLGHLFMYKTYGPLIGPKEQHQPNPRWDTISYHDDGSVCNHRTED